MDQLKLTEGQDENKVTGFILCLIAMLLLIEPLYGFIFIFFTGRAFASMPLLGTIYTGFGIGYLLFIFFTVFSFYKMSRYAIKIAKFFLIARFIFLTLSILINFNYTLHDPNSFGPRLNQFYTMPEMIIKTLVFPQTYVFLFSFWYVFLIKSKTIKENFGDHVDEKNLN